MLILCIGMMLSIWMLLVPVLNDPRQLALAIQDGLPLFMGVLGVLVAAYVRERPLAWLMIHRTVGISLAITAVLNIALWVVGMTGEAGNIAAQAAALVWFTLGRIDLEPPLYIGLMPDGFFRAMWITGTLYMPALMICIARRNWCLVLLFSVALVATYTRSLWLATAIGVLIAQLLSHPRKPYLTARMLAGTAILGAAVVAGSATVAGQSQAADFLGTLTTRLSSVFSDSSAEERYEQVGPLIDAWESSPIVGHGFGAHASVIRSEDAPFSYEMTVLALMMKLGAAGLLAFVAVLSAAWIRTAGGTGIRRNRVACASLGSILAFLLAAATNPFLLNFVGMSFLSYAFIAARANPRHLES